MRILFIFLDGIGLGGENPNKNPFARVEMPNLQDLLAGQSLLLKTAPYEGERTTLLALDACLGVEGLPQSATGQATLLTGVNVPEALGYHYGPKPNQAVAEFLRNDNIFIRLQNKMRSASLLNAYPPSYFNAIESGRRLYAAIPLAVTSAGIPLNTMGELNNGQALSADFTGQGWHDHLGFTETPVYTPRQAGEHLSTLARNYDLALFEFWLSDYAGHQQDMEAACAMLESFDQVLAGILQTWDDQEGLILITSDHGNMEDLSTRRHTTNPVPGLLIGDQQLRNSFIHELYDLTGISPAILRLVDGKGI
jgi:2,3-bisphosphoglycerate-independent phosphoglycerate mutase